MSVDLPFTIESFYQLIGQGVLMASRCKNCGKLLVPPRPVCPSCYSSQMEWVRLSGRGKIRTYTVIHVAPPEFVDKIPYIVAIVELEEGVKLPGMMTGIKPEEVQVGMEVEVDFQKSGGEKWPTWPRYHFKPRG